MMFSYMYVIDTERDNTGKKQNTGVLFAGTGSISRRESMVSITTVR